MLLSFTGTRNARVPQIYYGGKKLIIHKTNLFDSHRKPRDFPFPFSARLHAAFGSLSSPDRTRIRKVRAWSDQVLQPGSPRNLCRSSVCYETFVLVR